LQRRLEIGPKTVELRRDDRVASLGHLVLVDGGGQVPRSLLAYRNEQTAIHPRGAREVRRGDALPGDTARPRLAHHGLAVDLGGALHLDLACPGRSICRGAQYQDGVTQASAKRLWRTGDALRQALDAQGDIAVEAIIAPGQDAAILVTALQHAGGARPVG